MKSKSVKCKATEDCSMGIIKPVCCWCSLVEGSNSVLLTMKKRKTSCKENQQSLLKKVRKQGKLTLLNIQD